MYFTEQIALHWDQPKISGSGLLQDFILKLNKVLNETFFLSTDQLRVAFLMGSFIYLDKVDFPSNVLSLILVDQSGRSELSNEEIISTLLLAVCCKGKIHFCDKYLKISSVFEDQLLNSFNDLHHSELNVCYQGLQALSESSGSKLRSKMEIVYGFRM